MSRDSWDSNYRQPENGIPTNYNFGKGGFRESSHNSMYVFNASFFNIFLYIILVINCVENLVEKILSLTEEKQTVIEIMTVLKVLVIMIDVEMILIEHKKNLSG